uniref:Mitochondrial fission process protein 1 n=1 Tax=Graphocephala atropunctata TaxID=36148 RepID=A0A1B6M462_9HEMI
MDNKDLFRDTPIRYLGYANEVGEAFRAVIPTKAVWFSYGVACAYVACDAADKGFAILKKGPYTDVRERNWQGFLTACDALLWQTLASVVVPGVTINRLCWATRLSLSHYKLKPVSKVISVAVGLSAIPFIIKPIDKAVDHCMDLTVRPWLFKGKHD